MYSNQTFQAILDRMLSRVPNNIDKREGSIIYDALAPAAMELAQMYSELDIDLNLSFADTASGDFLTRRCAEFGVNREKATKAKRKGVFFDRSNNPFDVPIGSRYSLDELNYIALEQITTGEFILECETMGVIGNQDFGALIPIDQVPGLARAELQDVLVPGEDQETDEELRERYYRTVNEPSFGGNVSQYKEWIHAIQGVGGVKVYPVWNGGGTVKCTIIASDGNAPSPTLVDEVQTIMDPTVNRGLGLGTAPIGHQVTILGVQEVTINVETTVTLDTGVTTGQVQAPIEEVIGNYLAGLRDDWENQEQLIVRTALIDAAILTVPGVIDVNDTQLNGSTSNISLGQDDIPVLGTVNIRE